MKNIIAVSGFILLAILFAPAVTFAEEAITDVNEVQTANDAIQYARYLVENYESNELNYLQFLIKMSELENQVESFKDNLKKDIGPLVLGEGVNIIYLLEFPEVETEEGGFSSCAVISPSNNKIESDRADYAIKGEKVSVVVKFCTECSLITVNNKVISYPYIYFIILFDYPFCDGLSDSSPEGILSDMESEVLKYEDNQLTLKELYINLYNYAQDLDEKIQKYSLEEKKAFLDEHFLMYMEGDFSRQLSSNLPIYLTLTSYNYPNDDMTIRVDSRHPIILNYYSYPIIYDESSAAEPWNFKNVELLNIKSNSSITKSEICNADIDEVCFRYIDDCRLNASKKYFFNFDGSDSIPEELTLKLYCNSDLLKRYHNENSEPEQDKHKYEIWRDEIKNEDKERGKELYKKIVIWKRKQFEESFTILEWVCSESDSVSTLRRLHNINDNENYRIYYNLAGIDLSDEDLVTDSVEQEDCSISLEEKRDGSNIFMHIKYDIEVVDVSNHPFMENIADKLNFISVGRDFETNKFDGRWAIKLKDNNEEIVSSSFTIQNGTVTTVSSTFDKTAENIVISDVKVLFNIFAKKIGEGEFPPKEDNLITIILNTIIMFIESGMTNDLTISFSALNKIIPFLQGLM